jgi:hypothetical protein
MTQMEKQHKSTKLDVKRALAWIKTLGPWFAIGVCFLVGIVFLLSSRELVWSQGERPESIWPDLLRDLGIAFIVSFVLGVVIEFYRYLGHRMDSMREVIDAVMTDRITGEVWSELKELTEQKTLIRKNAFVRMSLRRREELEKHQFELSLEYSYELHGLSKSESSHSLEHELDYQLSAPNLNIPRFTRLIVNNPLGPDTVLEEADISRLAQKDKLTVAVRLPSREGSPVRIRVERIELVHAPGSYNLYTPEFLKGLQLVVSECPHDICIDVLVRPQGPGQLLKQLGDTWSFDALMLPGQGIEIKFLHRSASVS